MATSMFVQKAMELLGPPEEPEDEPIIRAALENLCANGWTLADAVAFHRCMIYYAPTLDESVALARMTKISQKYKINT